MALSLVVLGSCAHVDPEMVGREPAANVFAGSCKKLSKEQLATFKRLVLSDKGIAESMSFLGDLAHLFREDKTLYQKDRVRMDSFFDKDHGLMFNWVETYTHILLDECTILREGDDPNIYVQKKRHPKVWKAVSKLCGLADAKLPAKDRLHPQLERKWTIDYSDEKAEPVNIRGWVSVANNVYDPNTGDMLPPDKVAGLCTDYKAKANIEDYIEHLFVCLDAFVLNMAEYDFAKKAYVYDDKGKPQAKDAKFLKPVQACLAGYAQDKVEIAADGTPVGPKLPPPPPPQLATGSSGSSGSSGASGASGASGSSSLKPPTGPSSTSGASAASGQKPPQNPPPPPLQPTGGKDGTPNPNQEPSRCLPADSGDGLCKADKCIDSFRYHARDRGIWLPPELSSSDLKKSWSDERGEYLYQVAKEQAKVLGQAYVVTAYERRWDTPRAYNANIKEFAASCGNSRLRKELEQMTQLELLDEELVDSSYDPQFADQHDTSEDKGRRMVESVQKILALRQLVELLNYDMGAKEVTTLKYPKWLGYLPVGKAVNATVTGGASLFNEDFEIPYVSDFEMPIPLLHYMANQPVAISFGKTTNYQCNMFSTMMANDFVPRTRKLITEADRAVRKLLGNADFRKKTFCSRDGKCDIPFLFQYYMNNTDPNDKSWDTVDKMIADGTDPATFGMHLRDWCSMRWHAGQALMSLEQQVIAMYPALAHADMIKAKKRGKDDYPGPPLFDKLKDMGGSDEDKAKFAASEADRVLPGMQSDLKAYMSRICGDLNSGSDESAFMAVLNRQFLGGFNYCASVSPADQKKLGLLCNARESFYGCKRRQLRRELPHRAQQRGAVERLRPWRGGGGARGRRQLRQRARRDRGVAAQAEAPGLHHGLRHRRGVQRQARGRGGGRKRRRSGQGAERHAARDLPRGGREGRRVRRERQGRRRALLARKPLGAERLDPQALGREPRVRWRALAQPRREPAQALGCGLRAPLRVGRRQVRALQGSSRHERPFPAAHHEAERGDRQGQGRRRVQEAHQREAERGRVGDRRNLRRRRRARQGRRAHGAARGRPAGRRRRGRRP
ncbi:MAG: hypothetical protein HY075_01950 [Deltaproteobacteria bacterium]|nr:hypothetical protein [Deltaproteobacteria bacterium]